MSLGVAVLVFAGVLLLPDGAHAYFGPGAGVTMLGAVWGVALAILFALFAVLAWPIRSLLRRRKRNAEAASRASGAGAATLETAKPDAGA
jgi:hypothetical protein